MLHIFSAIILVCNSILFNEPEVVASKKSKSMQVSTYGNFQSFSKVLVYPMKVTRDFTVINSGKQTFTVDIMDENHITLLSFVAGPNSNTTLMLSSFDNGKYIVKMDSNEETHQFEVVKYKK